MVSYFKILLILMLFGACNKHNLLKELKTLPNYPSASGIEYFNKQFYIIGDDANDLLILDSNLVVKDSINLYSFAEKRIPKAIKADLEAITILPDNKLLLLGSGSSAPYRNTAWIIDPVSKQKENVRLDTFYQRLQDNGLKEINIEGMASVPGSIILSNRGNKGYPKNHLVFVNERFWEKQSNSFINAILFGSNADTAIFNGVSGLAYAAKSDQLICTVCTEDTRNNMDDGAIGKSYLWIVNDISSKKKWEVINPNKIIDLEETDHRFKGQKIESACIVKETKKFIHLVMSADNDNGSSTLFKMVIPKD